MLILSYSDDCGNKPQLNIGHTVSSHFRNVELPIVGYIFKFFLSTGLDKKEKNKLPLTCLKSILRIA